LLGDTQPDISYKDGETGHEFLYSRSFQVEGSEITLFYDVTRDFRETENVIGLLPGSDPLLRDEYIIITAHYDHLGIRTATGEIFNGADDNASGTAGILELARIFSDQRSDIRRSLLFIAFTAEEKGLLGSRYYTDNPVVPLEQTIVNLNLDMIGRVDFRYSGQEDTNYVYIIGSDRLSADLHSINERALALVPEITADYRYNESNDPNRFYFRSDHYNFIRHNIPAIFYFTGTHEDYHMPTDTADKIDFDRMETILRLIYATAWKLTETETRPLPDAVPSE
jgi:Zn-dependent M28 family amino/carboxypeptidase